MGPSIARQLNGYPSYGDYIAIARAGYEIRPVRGGPSTRYRSIDWRSTEIRFGRDENGVPAGSGWDEVLTVSEWYPLLRPGANWAQHKVSYYILTNVPASGMPPRVLDEMGRNAWRTNERDATGRPRFPNGVYEIVVRAWDAAGNRTERAERVRVVN
jgi:hypothetical protein